MADTRFKPGNPGGGRPKGSRAKLQESFLAVLHRDFDQHGEAAVQAARAADPVQYLNVIAKILPKETTVKHETDGMTLDELDRVIEYVRAELERGAPIATAPAGTFGSGEPLIRIPAVQ